MGRLSQLLSFVRQSISGVFTTDVQVDPGGGANVTALHAADAGDDSYPLAGDTAITAPSSGSGREVVVGYVDTANEPKAAEGEKRIYARKPDGTLACALWLKANGDAVFEDANGAVVARIASDGTTHLGAETGAALMARADRVDTEIDKLWTALGAHVHAVTVTGSATTQSGTTLAPSVSDTSAPTGADNVRGT